jgi:glutamyl-tRNA reductase
MRLVAAGLSFQTAPLPVREAAAVGAEQASNVLRYVVGHAGASGAAVLSTCNRTEFYAVAPDLDAPALAAHLALYLDPAGDHDLARHMQWRVEGDAIRHMFRVACGLESMVIGEAQVLGQFKDAHRYARVTGTLDGVLDFVMRRAVTTAKLVRTHTNIGRGAGNLSAVAVDCAVSVLGDLLGRGVLLLGAGKMSALAGRRLTELGAAIMTSSRGEAKHRLARELKARALPLEELVDQATAIDAIIASTASGEIALDAAMVAAMQDRRGARPLCIVDLAVPRDVEPAVAELPGVTLVDIDQLGGSLDEQLASRREAIPAAEAIIEVELRRTLEVLGQRDAAGPAIRALTHRAEVLRQREVERTLGRMPGLDAEGRERIDALTQSLVRKLLHGPITMLRESVDDPAVALVLRQAFALDDIEIEAGRLDTAEARVSGSPA